MNSVILLILLIPIIEIYLFIKIGSQIGAFTTISLIFITAIVGLYYAKYEGLNTMRSAIKQIVRNEIPIYEIVSGAALAFAALLMILPGFLTEGILDMNQAEIKKVHASIIKATRIPNRLTITPPRAAPKASMTDQVDPLRAFAVTRCSLGTSEGMMALLAGSKKPDREISRMTSA